MGAGSHLPLPQPRGLGVGRGLMQIWLCRAGVVSDPPPVPVRGGGGRWDTEIGIFTSFSFCIIGYFFSPRV